MNLEYCWKSGAYVRTSAHHVHSHSFADELSLASRLHSTFTSAYFAGIDNGPIVVISMVAPSGPVPSKCI